MTKYCEISGLRSLEFSQQNIAYSCNVSMKTVNRVIRRANELNIFWPLNEAQTNVVLEGIIFPQKNQRTDVSKRTPKFSYICK
jgi:hypothetical protein